MAERNANHIIPSYCHLPARCRSLVVFVFVICCPMHWNIFKIYCTPPNLGIRTWICRLNFAQRPIFSGLRFFNEPKISRPGTPSLKSLPEDLCSGFLRPEKNQSASVGFEPANLGSRVEHVTSRPPRPTRSLVDRCGSPGSCKP